MDNCRHRNCRKHIKEEVVVSYRGKEKLYTYEEWLIVGRALANLQKEIEKERQ